MELSEKSGGPGGGQEGSAGARVLLIGNYGPLGGGLQEALTSLECSFAHAAGSADALRQLRDTSYAVVITDADTSIQEDLALLDEIRLVRPGVRVIILAPSGTPEEIIEALRRRVFLCQCAPINAKEIAKYAVSALEADDPTVGIDVLSADRNWISVKMNCDMVNAERLSAFFNQFQMTLPEPPPEEMMIAFEEILQNAIEHGARNDPSKLVHVAAVQTARTFVFYISDPGKGFRRDEIPHAAVSYRPEQMARSVEVRERAGLRPGGYGILLTRGIVDELLYSEVGNEVLLIKYISRSAKKEFRLADFVRTEIAGGDDETLLN